MIVKIGHIKEIPTVNLIRQVEKDLNCIFSPEYLEFLSKYNGGVPEGNIFQVPDSDNESGVNEFIEISDIPKEFDLGGFGDVGGLIPIAWAEGGNYICLGISGSNLGAVLFWDHEIVDKYFRPVKIANSFRDFLNLLKPFDITSIKLNPDQVKSAWIDPDFLKNL